MAIYQYSDYRTTNGDLPTPSFVGSSMGKGQMAQEFPSEGKAQPAHLGSQSKVPEKQDSGKSDNFFGGSRDLNPFTIREAY